MSTLVTHKGVYIHPSGALQHVIGMSIAEAWMTTIVLLVILKPSPTGFISGEYYSGPGTGTPYG